MVINVFPCIREFYNLEAVEALASVDEYKIGHERWAYDFNAYRGEYNAKLAEAIYDYTVLVCAGETRHANSSSRYFHPRIYHTMDRGRAYDTAVNYRPNDWLVLGRHMFTAYEWSAGYGGESWGRIAFAGLHRDKWPDMIFIDHCVDLSHNNSIYFDKYQSNIFFMTEKDCYKNFLTWKSMTTPNMLIKHGCASGFLTRIIRRGINLGVLPKDAYPISAINEDTNLARKWILNYDSISWGFRPLPMVLQGSTKEEDVHPKYIAMDKNGRWVGVSEDEFNMVLNDPYKEVEVKDVVAKTKKKEKAERGKKDVVEQSNEEKEACKAYINNQEQCAAEWNEYFKYAEV